MTAAASDYRAGRVTRFEYVELGRLGRLAAADTDTDGDADTRLVFGYDEQGLRVERTEQVLDAAAPVLGQLMAVGAVTGSLTTRGLLDTSLGNAEAVAEYIAGESGATAVRSRFVFGHQLVAAARQDSGASPGAVGRGPRRGGGQVAGVVGRASGGVSRRSTNSAWAINISAPQTSRLSATLKTGQSSTPGI